MSGEADKANEVPDLSRHYRPVAIRSVVAAHSMIPRPREKSPPEPSPTGAFALPEGFHAVVED